MKLSFQGETLIHEKATGAISNQTEMNRPNELATYEKRIREIAPEIVITSINLNSEGLLNDAVIVNEELVFRFPKHECGFKHLKEEARILHAN